MEEEYETDVDDRRRQTEAHRQEVDEAKEEDDTDDPVFREYHAHQYSRSVVNPQHSHDNAADQGEEAKSPEAVPRVAQPGPVLDGQQSRSQAAKRNRSLRRSYDGGH